MDKLKAIFPVVTDNYTLCDMPASEIEEDEFNAMVEFTETANIVVPIQNMIVNRTEDILRDKIVPQFWSFFKKNDFSRTGFQKFYNAVKYLHDSYTSFYHIYDRLLLFRKRTNLKKPIYEHTCPHSALRLILRAILFSYYYLEHDNIIKEFYEAALKMEDSEGDHHCIILEDNMDCNCLHSFNETNRKLGEMHLLEPLVGQDLTDVIYNYTHSHIQKICKDSFDTNYIWTLEKWLKNVVLNWLGKIYCHDTSPGDDPMLMFNNKLTNFLYNSYTKIRIDQLFNIIIEYPESLPALSDLRDALPKTDLKPLLTETLQKAMETRLLHPGVSTPDILTAYVAAIRSLKVLDSTGLLLETVTQPVHQYLRSREDTVRCVVSSLTEEGPNDLAYELVNGEAVRIDENTPTDDDDENWECWIPDPIDSAPSP
ncbi:unnamed protein product [Acanthoscelides obtectus]|uniref:Anaphase-promoting complex subunit 2 TPR repeats domain-containing protein n=1 Tax=Acanthoscelides obtectus TaxID=200917 RepID=A0A9P0NV27_ACAOB|nr:unnamed protein product [Acanthoscelides obtectus]CAK1641409.1 Anaphase-promoting complex subunit 2 [Acanthoscelides obtectus]